LSNASFFAPFKGVMPFLQKHGSKLRELQLESYSSSIPVFDLCPNLTLLTLTAYSPIPEASWFQCKTEHASLEKVVIARRFRERNGRSRWADFFQNIDLTSFPTMSEIQVLCCTWPTTERDISKDLWHKWAEGLTAWDVKLTDSDGNFWKPRLQKSRH